MVISSHVELCFISKVLCCASMKHSSGFPEAMGLFPVDSLLLLDTLNCLSLFFCSCNQLQVTKFQYPCRVVQLCDNSCYRETFKYACPEHNENAFQRGEWIFRCLVLLTFPAVSFSKVKAFFHTSCGKKVQTHGIETHSSWENVSPHQTIETETV